MRTTTIEVKDMELRFKDGAVEIIDQSDPIYAIELWNERTFIGKRQHVVSVIREVFPENARAASTNPSEYPQHDWIKTGLAVLTWQVAELFGDGSWADSEHQNVWDIFDYYEDAPKVTREDVFACFETDEMTDELITIRRIV